MLCIISLLLVVIGLVIMFLLVVVCVRCCIGMVMKLLLWVMYMWVCFLCLIIVLDGICIVLVGVGSSKFVCICWLISRWLLLILVCMCMVWLDGLIVLLILLIWFLLLLVICIGRLVCRVFVLWVGICIFSII